MKNGKLKIDPEIKALIPPLSPAEREQLEQNIKTEKRCREPLVRWKGKSILLDGHHRREICQRNKIKFDVTDLKFASREDAMAWVIRNQFGRRNLNDYQRSELALKLEPLIAKSAEKRMKAGKPVDPAQNSAQGGNPSVNLRQGKTSETLAQIAGVSGSNIEKVKDIEADAAEPIQAMARKGEVSIDAAAKVSTLPKAEQRKVAEAGPKAVKEKAREIRLGKIELAEETAVVDEVGQAIPIEAKGIREAFANAEAIDECLRLLSIFSRTINPLLGDASEKMPIAGGEMLAGERQGIMADIKHLRESLKARRPHALCPYPHSKGQKCRACDGLGWVIERVYADAPAEYKKQRKGAA